eukprot:775501-Pelagomonas_calceolata.AAC.1
MPGLVLPLSPGKTLSLDSLPHGTPSVGAVAKESPADMQGQHSKQQQQQQQHERKKATKVAAVERVSRVPEQP